MPSRRPAALTRDIRAALADLAIALESLPAPGMVIGGIAVILHGVPRLTRDIDATVDGNSIELSPLAEHLSAQGIVPRIEGALDFARANQVLLLRHRDSGVDVDLSLAWIPFELEAIAARQRVVRGRLRAEIARAEDLVIYKAVAWRPQDQQDVERLLSLHAAQIDLDRVRRIIGEVSEALDEPERLGQLEAVIARVSKEP